VCGVCVGVVCGGGGGVWGVGGGGGGRVETLAWRLAVLTETLRD
jgi:hypothetical protein